MAIDKNRYLIALVESERACRISEPFETQSEVDKVFSAIWELESYVNNDGFDGFFTYAEPALIRYSPRALRTIGAESCAKVVESAVAFISPHVGDSDDWESTLIELSEDNGWWDLIGAFDQRFYEYPDDLTEMLFTYVEQHPETFGEIDEELVEKRATPGPPVPGPTWWQRLFGKR